MALLLGLWAAPRIYHRLLGYLPAVQRANWALIMEQKKRELSVRWQDPRPLIIFAGDSEVEFGDWYDFWGGAWAVRNCGLSSARIADVTELVKAIGDSRPRCVVLMCGVNNLGKRESPEDCGRDYEDLLAAVRSHLQPESVLVLSVMPVREGLADRGGRQFNAGVRELNTRLAACCRRHQVDFLDVTSAATRPKTFQTIR